MAVCNRLLAEMEAEVGGYDMYNIYDRCELAGDDVTLGESPDDARFGYCGQEKALVAYCNEEEVRAALHVPSATELGAYSSSAHLSYEKNEHDTHQYYLQLLGMGIRVLVYSGDV